MAITRWLKELWRYRELFYFFAWRDVTIRYRQTILGVLWAILQPLFTVAVFTILFGRVVRIPSDGIPYPVFYYAALLPWTYFSTTLSQSGNSLVGNSSLLTKIYFPRVILPISPALVGLIDFVIGMIVLAGLMFIYDVPPTWRLLLWSILLIPLTLLTVALGILLAALNVKYRDIKYVIPLLIQLLLFVTPIIYPVRMVPEQFRWLVLMNPLTGIIEAFRATLSTQQAIDWFALAVSMLVISLLFMVSMIYFRKTEDEFSDVV